jgi:hypothetical protein
LTRSRRPGQTHQRQSAGQTLTLHDPYTLHPSANRQHRHILLAGPYGPGADSIGAGQLAPFFRYRRVIRSQLGLSFEHVNSHDPATIAKACQEAAERVSAMVIRLDWRTPASDVLRFFAELRARYPAHWIVSIDPWDQCTGRFLGVLQYADRLVKYQAYRQRDDYYRPMVGGTLLTDYMAQRQAYDSQTSESLGSPMPAGAAQRVVTGWYFWSPRRLRFDLAKPRAWPFFPWRRTIDAVCHVSIGLPGHGSYYSAHRREAVAALRQLDGEFTIRASADHDNARTVNRQQYLHDCRHARIMVSPFGWGEVSSRDYESVVFGNLLVRPRVDHVEVVPNIFVAGETYAPVAWDWSDLASVCRHYLTHWDEAERLIANARQACLQYFEQRQYLGVIRQMLAMPGPDAGAPTPAPAEPGHRGG